MNLTMDSQFSRPASGPSKSPRRRWTSSLKGEAELPLEGQPCPHAARLPELVHEDIEHRAVKFLGLGHAHPVHLEADDVEAGAREKIDDAAGPGVREPEIVGLDEHQRLLDVAPCRELDGVVEQAAVLIRISGPELQVLPAALATSGGASTAGSK